MKMNSITDTITNAIFSPLKSWLNILREIGVFSLAADLYCL